ncbi:MAG: hypothetical protein KDI12_16960 [Anaerolineae bacterium]|nr:hypothetical protein [Anaerolineae bacterium]MCO5244396.1 DUF6516 family protein [Anaerolineae bacterium]
MIQAYFDQLKHVIDSYATAAFVLDAQISFELRPGDQGYVVGSVLFLDHSILHFREYLDAEGGQISRLTYSYHYQDVDTRLIFRYDNARHRPLLPTPDHKHIVDTIEASQPPSLDAVLAEIVVAREWI